MKERATEDHGFKNEEDLRAYIEEVRNRPLKTEQWPGQINHMADLLHDYSKTLRTIIGLTRGHEFRGALYEISKLAWLGGRCDGMRANRSLAERRSLAYNFPDDFVANQLAWIKNRQKDY